MCLLGFVVFFLLDLGYWLGKIFVFAAVRSEVGVNFALDVVAKHRQEFVPSLVSLFFLPLKLCVGRSLFKGVVRHVVCPFGSQLWQRIVSQHIGTSDEEWYSLLDFHVVEAISYQIGYILFRLLADFRLYLLAQCLPCELAHALLCFDDVELLSLFEAFFRDCEGDTIFVLNVRYEFSSVTD